MSTLAGMVAGFNLAAIARLQQTKTALSKKYVKILDELKTLFDPSSSYKNYRLHMSKTVQPAIPYMYSFSYCE
jgi:RasGEF domain.